eukprot:scaffold74063_cov63-Phaeocystis_antarctica.AAC.2
MATAGLVAAGLAREAVATATAVAATANLPRSPAATVAGTRRRSWPPPACSPSARRARSRSKRASR